MRVSERDIEMSLTIKLEIKRCTDCPLFQLTQASPQSRHFGPDSSPDGHTGDGFRQCIILRETNKKGEIPVTCPLLTREQRLPFLIDNCERTAKAAEIALTSANSQMRLVSAQVREAESHYKASAEKLRKLQTEFDELSSKNNSYF